VKPFVSPPRRNVPKSLAWLLWLALCLVIVGAFVPATQPMQGFVGQSGRILYFHVPCAWVSFLAFVVAGVFSARYLLSGRQPVHDRKAALAIGLGMLFGILATVSGAIWAKVQWGAYWNWDPRQTSITLVLLFYGAYLALRNAIEDRETRGRLSAAYALLGLVVAPFCFFVLPRITFSLHPEPVINSSGKIEMESQMLTVLLGGVACFSVLFFWLLSLADRIVRRTEPAPLA
jgi:heme exporter protein C